MLNAIFYILSGYLLGSILFAAIWAKIFHKDIISDSPDKNYGSANAYRYGGFFCGAATLICDLAKGFLPVFLFLHSSDYSGFYLPLVMIAPVLGHIFPIFDRFKGGKAIAVTFGVLMGFFPDWTAALFLASVFLFFSLIIKIKPHWIRIAISYGTTVFFCFFYIDNLPMAVGMLFIAVAGSIKIMNVDKGREKFQVKFLWQKMR